MNTPLMFPPPITLSDTADYKMAKRVKPSDMVLIAAMAKVFNVSLITAHTWIADIDVDGAADQIIDVSRSAA